MSDRPDSEGSAPAALEIEFRSADDALVVGVVGEVDSDSAPALRAALADAVDRSAGGPCVVDFTGVTFLGSAGLTALLDATRQADALGRSLRVVVPADRHVFRLLELTGLDTVLRLHHGAAEALGLGVGA